MQSESLVEVEKLAWRLLRNEEFRVIALASINPENLPEVRHLILRDVDMPARCLVFWTDMRSSKIRSFNQHHTVSISGYSDNWATQIGCLGQVSLHHKDTITEAIWHQATPYNKMIYSQVAPGSKIDARLPETKFGDGIVPSHENTNMGYENFCLLKVVVSELDYLHLGSSGNSRAHFIYGDDQNLIDAHWLA